MLAGSGAFASATIPATSHPSASWASTRTGRSRPRSGSASCCATAVRRSRPCSSTRRSPPAWATGSPTRCCTRRGSTRAAGRTPPPDLGRVRLRHDPRHEPPISQLGFDAYREIPPPERFCELLRDRGAPLKAVLLDQAFAAGVGNWIADEVLYQARLDPRRRAHTLTREEAVRLRARLRSVVALSVRVQSDSDRYPRSWLFHYRWGKRAGAMTGRGESIRYTTLGGRTTAWVPAVQR